MRDVLRDRHGTWRGLRWTLRRQAGLLARRNVCSVRRSRVVLAPRPWRLSMPACAGVATVTKNAAHRGEHEVSRKAIARGKPGCLGCTCQTRVRSSLPLHAVLRALSAPGFPCALSSERDDEFAKLGRKSCRENENGCLHLSSRERQSADLSPHPEEAAQQPSRRARPPAGPASFETRVPRSSG